MKTNDRSQVMTVSTPLGWMGAVGEAGELRLLKIGYPSEHQVLAAVAEELETPPEIADWHPRLADQLRRYAEGEQVTFADIECSLGHLTTFQRRVVAECRKIDYGKTLSYAQLALRAGTPRGARAVGNVMRSNRYPLVIPCHRVVATGGGLGGFSAPDGIQYKRRLLDLEQARQRETLFA